jgi:hypothetical protein
MLSTPWAIDTGLDIEDVRGFGYGEHLLIWTWRRLATGRAECPAIARAFGEACGEDGADVLATVLAFLQILAQGRRRRLLIGYPTALSLTADERQVLILLAAAQHGEAELLEAHVRWLAGGNHREALKIAARAVARALGAHEVFLPLPPASTPPHSPAQIRLADAQAIRPLGPALR